MLPHALTRADGHLELTDSFLGASKPPAVKLLACVVRRMLQGCRAVPVHIKQQGSSLAVRHFTLHPRLCLLSVWLKL